MNLKYLLLALTVTAVSAQVKDLDLDLDLDLDFEDLAEVGAAPSSTPSPSQLTVAGATARWNGVWHKCEGHLWTTYLCSYFYAKNCTLALASPRRKDLLFLDSWNGVSADGTRPRGKFRWLFQNFGGWRDFVSTQLFDGDAGCDGTALATGVAFNGTNKWDGGWGLETSRNPGAGTPYIAKIPTASPTDEPTKIPTTASPTDTPTTSTPTHPSLTIDMSQWHCGYRAGEKAGNCKIDDCKWQCESDPKGAGWCVSVQWDAASLKCTLQA